MLKIMKSIINLHKKTENKVFDGFSSLGTGVVIGRNLSCQFKNRISLGNYVYLGDNLLLNGRGQINIGDYSILSSEIIIYSSQHNYKDADMLPYNQIEILSPVSIGRCCWIGIRVIILPGVQIEEGCIIGAGSVVTRSFSKGSIIAGNPASLIGKRDIEEYDELMKNRRFYMVLKSQENLQKIEKVVPIKKFY